MSLLMIATFSVGLSTLLAAQVIALRIELVKTRRARDYWAMKVKELEVWHRDDRSLYAWPDD